MGDLRLLRIQDLFYSGSYEPDREFYFQRRVLPIPAEGIGILFLPGRLGCCLG